MAAVSFTVTLPLAAVSGQKKIWIWTLIKDEDDI